MAMSFSTTARTALAQALITALGATGAKGKAYNGTQPSGVSAITGGNTLLATMNWTSVPVGTATSGAIDFDEASMTQSSGSHVSGTPTFVDFCKSDDTVVIRVPIGAGGFTLSGTIVTGQNVTLTTLTITSGNT